MWEKNALSHKTSKFILFLLGTFLVVLSTLSVIRWYREGIFLSYIESWILMSSRWYYWDTTPLIELRWFPFYALELLWDTNYRRWDIDGAITAYQEALKIKSDSIIELKIALLNIEKNESGKGEKELSGALNPEVNDSISRIEKDAENREKYFGNGTSFTNIPPFFEDRDKEVIDW